MSVDTETIDWRDKALWTQDQPTTIDAYATAGHELFDGSVSWPALVLRGPVLRHNIATMAAYAQRHGMLFAPHGKTSMAPELFRMQLEAGAWGITVATPHQAMIALRTGIKRVLIAHEVLDGHALRKLVSERDEAGAELYCFVDSVEGVHALDDAVHSMHPFPVLMDIGFPGGRTGVRTVEQALKLAEEIQRMPGVTLVGVACYEGGLGTVEAVSDFFTRLRRVVEALLETQHLRTGSLVSAGGSAYFDIVAAELCGSWPLEHGVQILLRSGASVTHDDGDYAARTPFNRVPQEGDLGPALELWAQVISAPEPGLVLVGMGKRDAPFDEGLPRPKLLRRVGSSENESIDHVAECTRLNDQHGYVRMPESLGVRPGDLICFGISHPCTAFDKWRVLPVVDGDDRIVDVMRTYF